MLHKKYDNLGQTSQKQPKPLKPQKFQTHLVNSLQPKYGPSSHGHLGQAPSQDQCPQTLVSSQSPIGEVFGRK